MIYTYTDIHVFQVHQHPCLKKIVRRLQLGLHSTLVQLSHNFHHIFTLMIYNYINAYQSIWFIYTFLFLISLVSRLS